MANSCEIVKRTSNSINCSKHLEDQNACQHFLKIKMQHSSYFYMYFLLFFLISLILPSFLPSVLYFFHSYSSIIFFVFLWYSKEASNNKPMSLRFILPVLRQNVQTWAMARITNICGELLRWSEDLCRFAVHQKLPAIQETDRKFQTLYTTGSNMLPGNLLVDRFIYEFARHIRKWKKACRCAGPISPVVRTKRKRQS